MLKTYDETFTLRTRDCDLTGKWRPSAILESMQDAAGMHSMLLGCGRDELLKNSMQSSRTDVLRVFVCVAGRFRDGFHRVVLILEFRVMSANSYRTTRIFRSR